MTVEEICDQFLKEGYRVVHMAGGTINILYPTAFTAYDRGKEYRMDDGFGDYVVRIHTSLYFHKVTGDMIQIAKLEFRYRRTSDREMYSLPTFGMEKITSEFITSYCKKFSELLDQGDMLAEQKLIKSSSNELASIIVSNEIK